MQNKRRENNDETETKKDKLKTNIEHRINEKKGFKFSKEKRAIREDQEDQMNGPRKEEMKKKKWDMIEREREREKFLLL